MLVSGILLDAYHYGGGIGFRATDKWNRDNFPVLTSENKKAESYWKSFALIPKVKIIK